MTKMTKQTDLEKLKEILSNQAERGINGAYRQADDYEETGSALRIVVKLWRDKVTFVFTPEGRFIGMHNWKE